MKHAIVIGAGFGGIAAALRARSRGYRVTLVEKLDQLGGRAMIFKRGGYTFDAGPTVVTAPFLFDELYDLFGKQRSDYFEFVPLYPWYRIQFADGTFFDYGGTIDQTLEQIRKIGSETNDAEHDAAGYLKLLNHTKGIFDTGFTELGDKPFDTWWSMIRVAPQLMSLGAWRTVWQMACKYINNDKLRRVFSFQPLLVGGNPFSTTSIYSLIHYLEREWGVHFATGGTGSIVNGLGKLMVEEGVDIRLSSPVKQIVVNDASTDTDGKPAARGVVLESGEQIDADAVICNADAPFVHKHLIDAKHRRRWTDRKLDKLKYSMGLFVLYFGTTKRYEDVQHHTILLGDSYKTLLRELFNTKGLPGGDFSMYLHRPTATDNSLAPEGCDCFYLLCPAPNLQGDTDWSVAGPKYRELIIDELERRILPGLRDCIVEDFYVTPEHFANELSTLHGSGFSIQPTFDQSAYFRFHNRSKDIADLYFVGAGTHPGAGMPGVLCTAKVLEHVMPRGDDGADTKVETAEVETAGAAK